MTAYLSVIFAIIGVVLWFISAPREPAPFKELGKIMFACGLLAFLLPFGQRLVDLIGK